MAEYIERTEELILAVNAGARAIENTKRYHGAIYNMDVFSNNPKEIPYLKAAEVLRGVDELPSADVVPVVHGRWEEKFFTNDRQRVCSVCHCTVRQPSYDKGETALFNYCPICGARMDGK